MNDNEKNALQSDFALLFGEIFDKSKSKCGPTFDDGKDKKINIDNYDIPLPSVNNVSNNGQNSSSECLETNSNRQISSDDPDSTDKEAAYGNNNSSIGSVDNDDKNKVKESPKVNSITPVLSKQKAKQKLKAWGNQKKIQLEIKNLVRTEVKKHLKDKKAPTPHERAKITIDEIEQMKKDDGKQDRPFPYFCFDETMIHHIRDLKIPPQSKDSSQQNYTSSLDAIKSYQDVEENNKSSNSKYQKNSVFDHIKSAEERSTSQKYTRRNDSERSDDRSRIKDTGWEKSKESDSINKSRSQSSSSFSEREWSYQNRRNPTLRESDDRRYPGNKSGHKKNLKNYEVRYTKTQPTITYSFNASYYQKYKNEEQSGLDEHDAKTEAKNYSAPDKSTNHYDNSVKNTKERILKPDSSLQTLLKETYTSESHHAPKTSSPQTELTMKYNIACKDSKSYAKVGEELSKEAGQETEINLLAKRNLLEGYESEDSTNDSIKDGLGTPIYVNPSPPADFISTFTSVEKDPRINFKSINSLTSNVIQTQPEYINNSSLLESNANTNKTSSLFNMQTLYEEFMQSVKEDAGLHLTESRSPNFIEEAPVIKSTFSSVDLPILSVKNLKKSPLSNLSNNSHGSSSSSTSSSSTGSTSSSSSSSTSSSSTSSEHSSVTGASSSTTSSTSKKNSRIEKKIKKMYKKFIAKNSKKTLSVVDSRDIIKLLCKQKTPLNNENKGYLDSLINLLNVDKISRSKNKVLTKPDSFSIPVDTVANIPESNNLELKVFEKEPPDMEIHSSEPGTPPELPPLAENAKILGTNREAIKLKISSKVQVSTYHETNEDFDFTEKLIKTTANKKLVNDEVETIKTEVIKSPRKREHSVSPKTDSPHKRSTSEKRFSASPVRRSNQYSDRRSRWKPHSRSRNDSWRRSYRERRDSSKRRRSSSSSSKRSRSRTRHSKSFTRTPPYRPPSPPPRESRSPTADRMSSYGNAEKSDCLYNPIVSNQYGHNEGTLSNNCSRTIDVYSHGGDFYGNNTFDKLLREYSNLYDTTWSQCNQIDPNWYSSYNYSEMNYGQDYLNTNENFANYSRTTEIDPANNMEYYYGDFGNSNANELSGVDHHQIGSSCNVNNNSQILHKDDSNGNYSMFAVQKGNVLEIVPSSVMPEELTASNQTEKVEKSLTEQSKSNQPISKHEYPENDSSLNSESESAIFDAKNRRHIVGSVEVNRRHLTTTILRLNKESDGCLRGILSYNTGPLIAAKPKKRVLFADGIPPGKSSSSSEDDEPENILKMLSRKRNMKTELVDADTMRNDLYLDRVIETKIDPDLENAPPPPPPPGSPPPKLQQPIPKYQPEQFLFFHFDPFVNSMFVSQIPIPIPPRLLNQNHGNSSMPPDTAMQAAIQKVNPSGMGNHFTVGNTNTANFLHEFVKMHPKANIPKPNDAFSIPTIGGTKPVMPLKSHEQRFNNDSYLNSKFISTPYPFNPSTSTNLCRPSVKPNFSDPSGLRSNNSTRELSLGPPYNVVRSPYNNPPHIAHIPTKRQHISSSLISTENSSNQFNSEQGYKPAFTTPFNPNRSKSSYSHQGRASPSPFFKENGGHSIRSPLGQGNTRNDNDKSISSEYHGNPSNTSQRSVHNLKNAQQFHGVGSVQFTHNSGGSPVMMTSGRNIKPERYSMPANRFLPPNRFMSSKCHSLNNRMFHSYNAYNYNNQPSSVNQSKVYGNETTSISNSPLPACGSPYLTNNTQKIQYNAGQFRSSPAIPDIKGN